jgi:thioredoxin reductase (NADPH)
VTWDTEPQAAEGSGTPQPPERFYRLQHHLWSGEDDVSDVRDVIIIGSGPAGYTAALYAARANLKPLVFEGSVTSGGALMNTTDVENFPGFPEGIMGPELMDKFRAQAERFGAELLPEDVTEVRLGGDIKEVLLHDSTVYRAKAVILATGSAYRELGLPREKALSGHGVSWCATCDGFFFRDQDIAVVGGGDSALEEATFLTKFARTVTVIHRRDSLRASKIMQERARANPKIRFAWNSEVAEIHGETKVTGIRLRDTVTGEERDLEITGLFVAIGHDPRVDLVKGQVELDDAGYILVEGRTSQTNIPGVFACGDVIDHEYMQAITAAASGTVAALDVERYLAAVDDVLSGIGEGALAAAAKDRTEAVAHWNQVVH